MSAPDFSCGQGDDRVTWSIPVYDDQGQRVDVSTATAVTMHARINDLSTPAVDLLAAVTDTVAPGEVGVTFRAADTAIPGRYNATFEITLASGARITSPPSGWHTYEITRAA